MNNCNIRIVFDDTINQGFDMSIGIIILTSLHYDRLIQELRDTYESDYSSRAVHARYCDVAT